MMMIILILPDPSVPNQIRKCFLGKTPLDVYITYISKVLFHTMGTKPIFKALLDLIGWFGDHLRRVIDIINKIFNLIDLIFKQHQFTFDCRS